MKQHAAFVIAALSVTAAVVLAQSPAQTALARGKALWDQRLANSAIAALEAAAKDPSTAAEAHEALGRIYTFKGWQQESAFPGWHDEPSFRERALTELKSAVAAEPARASAHDALRTAQAFAVADKVDPAPPRPEIKALDARLQAAATAADISAAVDARAQAQADPAPYFTGAQLLIDHGDYDKAIAVAERGAIVSDRFVDENLSAYQMTGKSQGSKARGHAAAADLVGWAQFMKKNYAAAAEKLGEAERLSQGLDFVTQFHLGELARAQKVPARARDYYLDALSLSGGPAPLRQKAKDALAALQPGGESAGGFDAWLETELTRRRDDRKAAALKSLVDRPLPRLALTTVDGKPFDASVLRGRWAPRDSCPSGCGIGRAKRPKLKPAYAKYQNDRNGAFLLV